MDFIFLLTLFLVFSSLGSFLAAFTYRIERNLDFVFGRSFCDNCHKSLYWYDNIPLFSYLFLKGRSRCCNEKISIRYFVIEVITSIYLFTVYFFSLQPVYYLVFLILFAILVVDFETMIIPDELVFLLMLIFFIVQQNNYLYQNIFLGLIASVVYLTLNIITRGKGMGLGDVKLAIPLGFWLGKENILNWFILTFIIGGIFASYLLIFKKANLKTKLPFGPFMIVSFYIMLLIQ